MSIRHGIGWRHCYFFCVTAVFSPTPGLWIPCDYMRCQDQSSSVVIFLFMVLDVYDDHPRLRDWKQKFIMRRLSGQSESGISDSKPGFFPGSTHHNHFIWCCSVRRTVDVQRGFLPISIFREKGSVRKTLFYLSAKISDFSHTLALSYALWSSYIRFLRAKYIDCIHPYYNYECAFPYVFL